MAPVVTLQHGDGAEDGDFGLQSALIFKVRFYAELIDEPHSAGFFRVLRDDGR